MVAAVMDAARVPGRTGPLSIHLGRLLLTASASQKHYPGDLGITRTVGLDE